jgi:DegV family protein with EDD domain
VAEELGITVVPMNVEFGTETYRDGIDLTADEFFHKLETSQVVPKTSAPAPGLFAEVYDRLAEHTGEILTISLSQKFGAACEAALSGIRLMKKTCRVEVIDSKLGAMAQGLLAIEAAKEAMAGSSMDRIVDVAQRIKGLIHIRVTFDTLKYLARGGRIGKAQAFLCSLLKINPIVSIKEGEAFPVARERCRAKAIEWLYKWATSFPKIKALAIGYATTPDEAEELARRIALVFPQVPLYMSRVSPILGTHTGPGFVEVSVLEDK